MFEKFLSYFSALNISRVSLEVPEVCHLVCVCVCVCVCVKWSLMLPGLNENWRGTIFCEGFQYEISWKSAQRSSSCYKCPDGKLTLPTSQQLPVEEIGYEGVGWIEVAILEDFRAIWMKLQLFWDVVPCRLVKPVPAVHRFGLIDPEIESYMLFRNVVD
jgi:hypothetical protein